MWILWISVGSIAFTTKVINSFMQKIVEEKTKLIHILTMEWGKHEKIINYYNYSIINCRHLFS